MWEDEFSEHQIRGRRAISPAGLQGEGLQMLRNGRVCLRAAAPQVHTVAQADREDLGPPRDGAQLARPFSSAAAARTLTYNDLAPF